MFNVWRAPETRPTMDIDLLGITGNSIDSIAAIALAICEQDVEADGLTFDPGSIEVARIVEDADYAGVRVRLRGALGVARIAMQLDIGFGDVVTPRPPWHSVKPHAHKVARKPFLPLQGEGQDGDGVLHQDKPIPTPTLPLKGRELPSIFP